MGGHHNPKLKLGENERGSRTLAANVTISDFCKRLFKLVVVLNKGIAAHKSPIASRAHN